MIHTVCLELTTHCNKRCPDCCAGIGINRNLQHHPWSYFVEAARWLRGMPRIHLTGGEPTMHPHFKEYVPRLRELFNCRVLTMVTNGYRVRWYEDLIVKEFDYIAFSDYEDRRDVLESISKRMRVDSKHEGENGALFFPRNKVGGGKPCSRECRQSFGCSYADGKFFGCSVGPGLPDAKGLEPCEDWPARLMADPGLPCKTCFLSE